MLARILSNDRRLHIFYILIMHTSLSILSIDFNGVLIQSSSCKSALFRTNCIFLESKFVKNIKNAFSKSFITEWNEKMLD